MSATTIRTLLKNITNPKHSAVERAKFRFELASELDKMQVLDTFSEGFSLFENEAELNELGEALVGNTSVKVLRLYKPFNFKGNIESFGAFFEKIGAEITDLNLPLCPIDEGTAKQLSDFISRNTQLKNLTISDGAMLLPEAVMDPKVFSILSKGLRENKAIEKFSFNYLLKNESVSDLAEIIKAENLTRLVFHQIQAITPESREALQRATNESRTLEDLTWFGASKEPWYNSWRDAIKNQLSKNENSNASLREAVPLENKAFEIDASMSEKQKFSKLMDFLEVMGKNPTESQKATLKTALNHFTKLDLRMSGETDTDLVNLFEALETNETVTHVIRQAGMGKMGSEALRALSNVLSKNKTIHTLDLRQAVDKNSIYTLATILETNKTLLHLDLGDNPLGKEAGGLFYAQVFAQALAKNNTLKFLDLRATGLDINKTVLTQLRQSLLNNTALEVLLLGSSDGEIDYFGTEGLQIVDSLLETNKTLMTLMNDTTAERSAVLTSIKQRLKSNSDRREEIVKQSLSTHLVTPIADIVREYLGPYDPSGAQADLTSAAERRVTAMHQAATAVKRAKEAADKAATAAKAAALSMHKAMRASKRTEKLAIETAKEKANKAAEAAQQFSDTAAEQTRAITNPAASTSLPAAQSPAFLSKLKDWLRDAWHKLRDAVYRCYTAIKNKWTLKQDIGTNAITKASMPTSQVPALILPTSNFKMQSQYSAPQAITRKVCNNSQPRTKSSFLRT